MENSTLRQKLEYRFAARGPCGVLDPCGDEDEYDPCGSSDDITEKDLAVLLKEEAAKLEQSKPETVEKETEQPVEEVKPELEPELQPVKKKTCRKFIKNPFFTNRLRFSSEMPPKPPTPPPQFLPLVEDVDSSGRLKCRKQKRKKCKKKIDLGAVGGAKEDKGNFDEDEIKDENLETEGDTESKTSKEGEGEEGGQTDEQEAGGIKKKKKKFDKKKCKKKQTEKPLCKKKQSEVSISLLPPQIPPLQRDLPLTSPKDIPEVERQILMACGNEEKKCKKQTNKCKIK